MRIGDFNRIHNVYMGRHTYTMQNTVINNAKLGKFTSISWNVSINPGQHDYDRLTQHEILYVPEHSYIKQPVYSPVSKEVILGSDVWVGANAVILPGIKVGNGVVIGAGAVVTNDIPDYAIVVGVPAKVIKYRFDKKTVRKLLRIAWWDLPEQILKERVDLLASRPTQSVLSDLKTISKEYNN